jgi:hypothetical protein
MGLTPPQKQSTSRFTFLEGLKLLLAVIVGLGIPAGLYFGNLYLTQKKNQKEEAAKAAYEKQRPHDEAVSMINVFIQKSQELTPCPLIYPLLNEKGKLTRTGTYLSYLAMNEASFLPESVLRLPNIASLFQSFGLFEPGSFPGEKYYRTVLPVNFEAKDFGEGTWSKNKIGYQVSLRFWGTHPEKKYKKTFDKHSLHLVPNWIAQCLHDWIEYHLNAQQTAFISQPIYTNDKDFIKGADVQDIARFCPGLICNWNRILATNPKSAHLFSIELALEDDRMSMPNPDMAEKMLVQNPQDTQLQILAADEYQKKKSYEQSWKTVFTALLHDDNNNSLYEQATKNLEDWGFYEEAIQLAKAWTLKHPNNPECWIRLACIYEKYAWEARGDGWASTVTKEGWKLMGQRMAEAKKAFDQALKIAPKDYRVYLLGLNLGTGLSTPQKTMEGYFQVLFKLNPYCSDAYEVYADYLSPKWSGDETAEINFVNKYWKYDPYLTYEIASEDFYDNQEVNNDQEAKDHLKRMQNNIRRSPHLKLMEKGMKQYFKEFPEDSLSWAYYMYWVQQIGWRDRTLAYAKKSIPKNPELISLYPTIVLNTISDMEDMVTSHEEERALHDRPDVIKLEGEALQALVKADPDNMNYWNRMAFYYFRHHKYNEAKKCLIKIGDHYDLSIWDPRNFKMAKELINKSK